MKLDTETELQLRLKCLEPKTEYIVRVAAVRTPCGAESYESLVGRLSPACRVTTLLQSSSQPVMAQQPSSPLHSQDGSLWTDGQLGIIILVGFVFFVLLVAFIVQQIISISL